MTYFVEQWTILEAVVIIAIALLVTCNTPLSATFRALPRHYQAVVASLLAMLLGGQMISRGEITYPFTDWGMYCESQTDDPAYFDYMMTLSSGEEKRLPISRLFPSIGKTLRKRIDDTARTIQDTPIGPERDQAIQEFEAILVASAGRYNATHQDDPVQTIRVLYCVIPIQDYRGTTSIVQETFRELVVD